MTLIQILTQAMKGQWPDSISTMSNTYKLVVIADPPETNEGGVLRWAHVTECPPEITAYIGSRTHEAVWRDIFHELKHVFDIEMGSPDWYAKGREEDLINCHALGMAQLDFHVKEKQK